MDIWSTLPGFLGVVVGAALTTVYEEIKIRRATNANATYTGIQIIAKLELFIDECAEVASDDGTVMGQTPPDGILKPQVKDPILEFKPEELDWTVLKTSLMTQIFLIPTKLHSYKLYLNEVFFQEGPDYHNSIEERQYLFSRLGIQAYEVLERLKNELNINDIPENLVDFDSIGRLRRVFEKIKKVREERDRKFESPTDLKSDGI